MRFTLTDRHCPNQPQLAARVVAGRRHVRRQKARRRWHSSQAGGALVSGGNAGARRGGAPAENLRAIGRKPAVLVRWPRRRPASGGGRGRVAVGEGKRRGCSRRGHPGRYRFLKKRGERGCWGSLAAASTRATAATNVRRCPASSSRSRARRRMQVPNGRMGRGGRDARWDRRVESHSIAQISRRFFRSVPTRKF